MGKFGTLTPVKFKLLNRLSQNLSQLITSAMSRWTSLAKWYLQF